MKNLITLSLFATALLDLVVITGSSFSQKPTGQPKLKVDSSVLADPKFQKFIADTTEWSKKLEQKVDSVRIEHSITKQRQEDDKELIKIQKKNFQGLYELHMLTNRGLDVLNKILSEDVKTLPDIPYARPLEEPKEMVVGIALPDTLPVHTEKKSFWRKIQFWKK